MTCTRPISSFLHAYARVPATLLFVSVTQAQVNTPVSDSEKEGMRPGNHYAQQPETEALDLNMYERIRTEGLTHGHAMDSASALADGIRSAPDWLAKYETGQRVDARHPDQSGMANAHLEDWGEFGMGWSQVNAWTRLISPDTESIWLQAAVWSD